MFVMIDEPAGLHFGGDVAAPVFKAIAEKIMLYLRLFPELPAAQRDPPMKYLDELLGKHESLAWRGDLHVPVSGIEFDSRRVRKGNCYVAIKGFLKDGIAYVAEAVANGAAASSRSTRRRRATRRSPGCRSRTTAGR